jgi:hypothetical protein
MAGFFGLESLLGGSDKNAINQTYGVPQGIVDNSNYDSMIGLGGLLMAAGQRQTPQQRAQMLSQLGNAVAAGDRSLYTGAQSYLMGKKYQDEAGMSALRKKYIEAQTNHLAGKGTGHWASQEELPPGYDGKNPIWIGEDGPKAVGSGGTTINNVANPIVKGVGEQFSDSIEKAKTAVGTIRSINAAREQLDMPGGITTGLGANAQLDFKKAASLFGADPAQVTNTESFRAAIKPIVLSNVKALGAGNAISNADREFVEKAVGGDINLDESSIRRILDINERAARFTIENHNKTAEKMLKTTPELAQMSPLISVDMPEAYQRKQSDPLAAARAAIQAGADRQAVVNRLLKSGINPKGL